jgi:single-strand DNA-binding protein
MNVYTFTGNLARDAKINSTEKGDSVGSFSVGVKSGYGDKAVTNWINCSLWGKRADSLAPYLMKGQGVAISGELSLRKYKSKDGTEGASMEVRVADVTLIGSKEDRAPMTPQMASKSMSKADGGFDAFDSMDDVPFN